MKLYGTILLLMLLFSACAGKTEQAKEEEWEHVFTAADADADYAKGTYRFIEYGLVGVECFDRDSLAAVYGFTFYNLGCETTDSLMAGADEYNRRMAHLLQQRNGRAWKFDYEWKCDSLEHAYYLARRNDTNFYWP